MSTSTTSGWLAGVDPGNRRSDPGHLGAPREHHGRRRRCGARRYRELSATRSHDTYSSRAACLEPRRTRCAHTRMLSSRRRVLTRVGGSNASHGERQSLENDQRTHGSKSRGRHRGYVGRLGESMTLSRGGYPVIGCAEPVAPPVAPGPGPWTIALTTTVVSAATGWVIEEIARSARRKRQRR